MPGAGCATAMPASSSRSGCRTTPSGWPRCARRWARGRRCGWTPTAAGRSTRPCGRSARSSPTTSSSSNSPAAACGSWPRCASASRRPSPPTSRSPRCASCARGARAGGLRRGQLKLAGTGGFKPARELLREARAHGLDAFLSSTLDGPWGIAAALQLAAAEEISLACGLATLDLFDGRGRAGPAAPAGGTLKVRRAGPGRGVDPARSTRPWRRWPDVAGGAVDLARYAVAAVVELESRPFGRPGPRARDAGDVLRGRHPRSP